MKEATALNDLTTFRADTSPRPLKRAENEHDKLAEHEAQRMRNEEIDWRKALSDGCKY
jgi:hypothetical protein